jgi:DNA polymerase-3 subunit beta
MQFTVNQNTFLQALTKVSSVVPPRSTIPALNNVLLELKGSELALSATDLEISLSTKIEVQSEQDGQAVILARKLYEIVRELPDVDVSININEERRMEISCDRGKYYLSGDEVEDFPLLPSIEEGKGKEVTLDADKAKRMIGKTLFAVSKDELQPALTGVLLELRPKEARCVSTDGYRLVKIIDKAFRYNGEQESFIVPQKAMNLLLKFLEDEKELKLKFDPNHLIFQLSNTDLTTRLIEGKYPRYEAAIPSSSKNILKADLEILRSSIRRASIFADSLSRQIRFKISGNEMEIQAEDIEVGGSAKENLEVDYQGEELQVGYNANYILDALKHLDTEEIVFELGAAGTPGVLKPIEQEPDEDFMMLVMPIR